MNWSSWNDFVNMGGYGLYVWGAFGACAVALVAEVGSLAARRRALKQQRQRPAAARFNEVPHEAQG
jgi:heme exporter protein D